MKTFITWLLVVVCVFSVITLIRVSTRRLTPRPDSAPVSTQFERYAVVTEPEFPTIDLVWVIAPDQEWRIVPEAFKPWAKSLKEGQESQLPESFPAWVRANRPNTGSLLLLEGYTTIGQNRVKYNSVYFFAKPAGK